MAVVVYELNHRVEGKWIGETVLSISVKDLNKLVVSPFPVKEERVIMRNGTKLSPRYVMLFFSPLSLC